MKPTALGTLDPKKPIHIYGAGVSGLLMGYYLKKHGYDICIFEKDQRAGGKIRTHNSAHGPVETAANAIYSSELIVELINELNLNPIYAQKGLKRLIWIDSKGLTSPLRWPELVVTIIKSLKKIPTHCLKPQTSLKEFLTPWLGEKLVDQKISAAFSGIYAAPAHELHLQSLTKLAPKKNQRYLSFVKAVMANKKKNQGQHRSRSLSFKNGMQEFINALKAHLKDHIKFSTTSPIDPQVNSIICTDAYQASKLLHPYPQLAQQLEKIAYTSISTSTVFTKKTINPLKAAFGCVKGVGSNALKSIGILNNGAIFTHRLIAPAAASYTCISKRQDDPGTNAQHDLATLNQATVEILSVHSTQWKRAIPLYNYQRYLAVEELKKNLEEQNESIILFGNYLGGISIRELAQMAQNFALQSQLNSTFRNT